MARHLPRLLALAASLLAACSGGSHEETLDDYLHRLARPLKAEIVVVATAAPVAPRAEALALALESDSLDGLDFMRLRGCALQSTIARRNSSLGQIAPPSQRLLLELAFIREAPSCVELLKNENRGELAEQLAQARELKITQLPARIFNATLAAKEFRYLWRSNRLPRSYPQNTNSEVITALEEILEDSRRWLSGDYTANERRFELALSAVASGDGGELLRSLQLLGDHLATADEFIGKQLAGGPLCRNGLEPAAAPILRTVVRKYFVTDLQGWAASLSQRYHDLTTPLLALEELLAPALPTLFNQWREERDAALAYGMAAPKTHVRNLQALLGSCYSEFAPAPENASD